MNQKFYLGHNVVVSDNLEAVGPIPIQLQKHRSILRVLSFNPQNLHPYTVQVMEGPYADIQINFAEHELQLHESELRPMYDNGSGRPDPYNLTELVRETIMDGTDYYATRVGYGSNDLMIEVWDDEQDGFSTIGYLQWKDAI